MVKLFLRRFHTKSQLHNKPNYSKTLHLPKTNFGPKIPRDGKREQLIKQTGVDLYKWQQKERQYNTPFIVHDGPPYANGDLHIGHALNKICKDMINRFELIYTDKLIEYQPGWDCHGLPIELKVEGKLSTKEFKDPMEIRKACKEWAKEWIEKQKLQFGELGIMTDFNKPYVTMNNEYEYKQLLVFRKLIENGLLSQQLKPVWWGCETQTALAEAELEYNDNHKSVAVYVKFPVVDDTLKNKLNVRDKNLYLLIWTSTPWTIPANKAICVNENFTYTLIEKENDVLVVAKSLVEKILKLDQDYKHIDTDIPGKELINVKYINPAAEDGIKKPVLHGDHVVESTGTGLVHTAPAHGGDDYLTAKQNNINIESSFIDNHGKYIVDQLPKGFQKLGPLKVNEIRTNMLCVELLKQQDMIFHLNKKFTHSYPYDWRSKTPVIQRATPQWFVNVEKIKPVALKAISKANFYPKSGYNRLSSFIENRNEWCISRQRSWGVPLPIIYKKKSNEPVLQLEVIDHIIDKMKEFGTDQWFSKEDDISRWIPNGMKGTEYYKGQDTMDVWFDSGTSWTTLRDTVEECNDSETPLADVYLEGSDQHRGWFQSSLLNKVIASGDDGHDFKAVAPFKNAITHGFITDGKGQKMSKSKGNIFSPKQAMDGNKKPLTPYLGTDGLRLWVASSNYKQDVSFNPEVLTRVSDVHKKYRLTFKYLLGNLVEYQGPIEYDQLSVLDKYVLNSLYELQESCIENYKEYNFSRVISSINLHVNSILSAIYFDVSKDCLYTDSIDSVRRKSIQTVLNEILKTYIGILAPIQPLLVQEVWDEYKTIIKSDIDSPFKLNWDFYSLPKKYKANINEMTALFKLRDEIYKDIELLKQNKFFTNKLELEIQLSNPSGNSKLFKFLEKNKSLLDDIFLVSKVSLIDENLKQTFNVNGEEIGVTIRKSDDQKCLRCWKFTAKEPDTLCNKCENVVNNDNVNM
ncbi:ISM1 [Candida pseudojiufengensis]|uniref:ISM1 n=1 Tax=Candida pseudojiufengensis TaxID=497109 RepID=UPI0022256646|nr:ISM1 [Candida pseudojiufengensis]KAI5963618.1 ISM1 [Candida pseudojiufengensis]